MEGLAARKSDGEREGKSEMGLKAPEGQSGMPKHAHDIFSAKVVRQRAGATREREEKRKGERRDALLRVLARVSPCTVVVVLAIVVGGAVRDSAAAGQRRRSTQRDEEEEWTSRGGKKGMSQNAFVFFSFAGDNDCDAYACALNPLLFH